MAGLWVYGLIYLVEIGGAFPYPFNQYTYTDMHRKTPMFKAKVIPISKFANVSSSNSCNLQSRYLEGASFYNEKIDAASKLRKLELKWWGSRRIFEKKSPCI